MRRSRQHLLAVVALAGLNLGTVPLLARERLVPTWWAVTVLVLVGGVVGLSWPRKRR